MRVNFTLKVKKAANNNTRLAKSEDNTRRPSGRRSGFVVFFGGGGIMNAKYLGTPIPIGRHAQDIALDWLPSLTNRGVSSFGERRRMRNSRNWFHFLYFFFSFRVPFREPTETNRTRLPIGYRPDVSRPIRDLVLPAFRLALRGGRESKEFENST